MINPTAADIGQLVIYNAGHPGAEDEVGEITNLNESFVFVRYKIGGRGIATNRCDLRWHSTRRAMQDEQGKTREDR